MERENTPQAGEEPSTLSPTDSGSRPIQDHWRLDPPAYNPLALCFYGEVSLLKEMQQYLEPRGARLVWGKTAKGEDYLRAETDTDPRSYARVRRKANRVGVDFVNLHAAHSGGHSPKRKDRQP